MAKKRDECEDQEGDVRDQTSTKWPDHMDDPSKEKSAVHPVHAESSPAGSSRSLELPAVEGRDTEKEEAQRAVSAMRRAFRQLCRRSMLTFTLASALCILTQINVAVFMMTQVSNVVFLPGVWRMDFLFLVIFRRDMTYAVDWALKTTNKQTTTTTAVASCCGLYQKLCAVELLFDIYGRCKQVFNI